MLAALDALSIGDRTVAELAAELAVPPDVISELIAVLEAWRGVEQTSAGRWRLGSRLAELGGLAWVALVDQDPQPA
jgi:DNA-binding IclR family transcriptional regulator